MSLDQARELVSTFGELQPDPEVPGHAIWRMTVLLGNESWIYVDAENNSIGSDGAMAGYAIVVAKTRIVAANWDGSYERPSGAASSVDVRTWSRRSLTSASIETVRDGGRNRDSQWTTLTDDLKWPRYGQLVLRYGDNSTTEVRLPLRSRPSEDQRVRFMALVPQLLADLA